MNILLCRSLRGYFEQNRLSLVFFKGVIIFKHVGDLISFHKKSFLLIINLNYYKYYKVIYLNNNLKMLR